MPEESTHKLSLFDAVGMAVGGMVGGGIFAVLGAAAAIAGNGAFLSFGLAGALALVTGVSYARLTVSYDEPGGSFSYVEELAGPSAAGMLSWFLLVGYLFTNALYSYTFGAYGARLLGVGSEWTPYLGSGILILLSGVNVAGVRMSAAVEDVVVYVKLALLIGLGVIGVLAVRADEAFPIFEGSGGSVVGAAALVFVGYEGFQLLTYDYDDISNHETNLHRAIWIAVPCVTLLYMFIAFVLTGSVDASTIVEQEETVLAEIARPLLGRTGIVIVLVAAVFSTASAINATLFGTGRLSRRVADDGQLPTVFTRWIVRGVPTVFLTVQLGLGIILLFTADLGQIVAFSSVVFLMVFGVVNGAAVLRGVFAGWQRSLPFVAMLGCLGAVGTLAVELARDEPSTLIVIGCVAAFLVVGRVVFDRVAT